jgi:CSLREA domain-containing protein
MRRDYYPNVKESSHKSPQPRRYSSMLTLSSGLRASSIVILALLVATALFLTTGDSARAANFTVTKTADTNDGTCNADCSLREAITAAEAAGGSDTVVFSPGVFPAGAPATIALGSELPTSSDTAIDGTGAGVVIDGSGAGVSVTGLNFNSGGVLANATVRNITLRNFSDTGINMNALTNNNGATIDGVVLEGTSGGININAGGITSGASITNTTVTGSDGTGININAGDDTTGSTISGSTIADTLGTGININSGGDNVDTSLINSTVSDNATEGVVLNAGGELTGASIDASTISGNGDGGVIASGGNAAPPGLTVSDSTISGNTTQNDGGGIASDVDTVITGSTISGNTGDDGGGIQASALLRVTNSTISGNTALVDGGGIDSSAPAQGTTVFLTNVTIVNNTAQSLDTGGGILLRGTADVLNTIIANNTDQGGIAPDCDGNINSLGHNLIEDTTGCTITGDTTGNITGTDPQISGLVDNGGPTLTHAFAEGAPPHNAGSNTGCPGTDQRGLPRPAEGTCDIGAYERQVATPTPVPASATPTEAPAELPPTGGRTEDGSGLPWVWLLGALGALVGAGTFVVARRRS